MKDGYSDDLRIERENNDGDYSPDNCKWATITDQANNKRSNVFLELHGKRMTVAQWARELGIPEHRLGNRVRLGWSDEDALCWKTYKRRKKH